MVRSATISRRGISMMEVALGTLLVGGVLAGTLNLVGPTVRASGVAGDEMTAGALAGDLVDEIAALPYEDPQGGTGLIGVDSGESGHNRTHFDDVDDYDGWSSFPSALDGSPLPGLGAGWARRVEVVWVTPENPGVGSATESGVKRVTVSVSRNGTALSERSVLRSRSFDLTRAEP